jgi:hypothetical protein
VAKKDLVQAALGQKKKAQRKGKKASFLYACEQSTFSSSLGLPASGRGPQIPKGLKVDRSPIFLKKQPSAKQVCASSVLSQHLLQVPQQYL